jgi:hypothetical protein
VAALTARAVCDLRLAAIYREHYARLHEVLAEQLRRGAPTTDRQPWPDTDADELLCLVEGPTRSRAEGIDNGRCSTVPGFGMNTRRAGNGRHRPFLRSCANSSRSLWGSRTRLSALTCGFRPRVRIR